MTFYKVSKLLICFLLTWLSLSKVVSAQNDVPIRLRGTILEVAENSLVFKERSGEVISLVYESNLSLQEVYRIEMSKIEKNSYIGTAAMTDSKGRLVALEVHVFPESMRGTGEGHRPWDSVPGSTMTNANVDELVSIGNSRELHLKYKDGEKIVFVPDNVPIVAYRPTTKILLVKGANAIITAAQKDGKPTASRIVVGRDGFKPPM